ncbi:hypothetical protein [Lutispora sp.]|uniref:hypothetical protein n=1 Tax=Lutispora sp. TaxID=2828727 RepID=UPI003563645F
MEFIGHYQKILFHSLTKARFYVPIINPIKNNSIKNIEIRKAKKDNVDVRKAKLFYRF